MGLTLLSSTASANEQGKVTSAKSSSSSKVMVKVVPREKKPLSDLFKEHRIITTPIPVFSVQGKQAMQTSLSPSKPLKKSIEIDFEDLKRYL